jgi:sugar-specific transcriptional regulator TrmB
MSISSKRKHNIQGSLGLSIQERGELMLRELGLTFSQAKVYLALSKFGESCTAKMASDSCNVARQDVYRIIAELEQLGLIEKVIANPTRFKTTPIREALSLLLENRAIKTSALQIKAFQLAADFSEKYQDPIFEKDQFILIPEKTAFARLASKAVEADGRSMNIITSWKGCVQLLSLLSEVWSNFFKKGINVRWLTEQSSNGSSTQGIAPGIIRNHHFSIRVLPNFPVTRLGVYDGVGAFIEVSSTSNGTQVPTLWTNNGIIVSFVAEYFEMKWKTAETFDIY